MTELGTGDATAHYRALVVQVAIDSGPLHGQRTGIGNAVAWYLDELERSPGPTPIEVARYVTSARATLEPGERRLALPAAAALRWWARADRPRVDRALGHPDVVHGTNYVVPPTRAPRLVSVYDCWFLDHPDHAHRDVRLAGAVLERALGQGATALVSSEASADRLRHHLGSRLDDERVDVVHLGPPLVDDVAGRPDADVVARLTDSPFVVAIGTIERRKNLTALVGAFDRLASEHPSVVCVIAGADGDDADALGSAIDRLAAPVRDRIVRTGRVTPATKRWLLDHARALAYPSLDEGFGYPLLEAQQRGLPIAASTAGSIPEIAGAGAALSAPHDIDALAANLFGLLDDGPRRDRLVAAGARNLARFSWADCVRSTTGIYRRLAGESS